MEKTKILELIPENLREDLIQEVKELLKEEAEKSKKIPATDKELEAVTQYLKI